MFFLLTSCQRDTTVTIVPGFEAAGAAVGPVVVTILPYDPDAIRDSLARAYGVPMPRFPDLEAHFRAWRPPEITDTTAAVALWRATRDSVEALSDSLRRADRRSAGYAAAYARFRTLYQRFAQRSTARNAELRESTAEARDLAVRAGRAADSLRRWEEAAWAGYEEAVRAAREASGRDSMALVIEDEPVEFTLSPGSWWVLADARLLGNPFLSLHWRGELVTAGFPVRVPLDADNGRSVWRH